MRAAIMQPTYLPWMGYFALMDRVDTFVLLDSVQFARRSWQQRNRIKSAAGELMLTVPVFSKGRRDQRISEIEIDRTRRYPDDHIRAIELNYKKAPYFDAYAPQLFSLMRASGVLLVEITIPIVQWLAQQLGIQTQLRRSGEFAVTGQKAGLLAEICSAIGADEYISPPGSRTYLDESSTLQKRSIRLTYNEYVHPIHSQLYGAFLPNLSVIDLLFNVGPASLDVIRSGYRDLK